MNTKLQKLLIVMLILAPGTLWAQTGGFSGDVPATYSILNTTNGDLTGTLGSFGSLTIGKNSLMTSSLDFRLRSNEVYKLTAQVSVGAGITKGVRTAADNIARSIKTGDIGFGITAIDKSGANVVNGGASPTRTDTITATPNFADDPTTPSHVAAGKATFAATLHDIDSETVILQGDRISAGGDNNSTDNYLQVTVKAAVLPEYFSSGSFSGTVTFTIAHQ
jgi:hypothetical protein